ncbi:LysR family transcriptional regulator [Streptomyces sp. WMMC897]|uniref:LysR family transcriptional regulator n=1 Tax=Streptomyces sp. WMMC897 TaxID=3014782 RepID=UPI0022B6F33A|nr:LysR family transcriptional regulator [Streptomyces sp. WMMC897]MCZ7414583.1 LysR family transcriptional regulator [Streptomyces sp. WMMC897]
MDVDTRLLRYAVAVAEEGGITRAAERLYVSQPTLTKQIRQLETQLGVRLFVRSRSGMTLTEAGTALMARLPDLLDGWEQARRAAKAADSRAVQVLRVGFLASAANEATPDIVGAFSRRRSGWKLEMRQAAWSDPSAGLLDGETDVALVRVPFPGQEDLRVAVLFTEPRCVALPAAHRLAAREVISFSELCDEPFIAAPAEAGWFRDHWLAVDERGGRPVRIGAVTDQPDDWLNAIANGYGIALAPASATRYYARPGIVYRAVESVSPSQVAVAWAPGDDQNAVVQDFVRCCLGNRPSGS